MKYRIGDFIVASELAARAPSQASRHLVAFLRNWDRVAHAVDYGCGKLRYAPYLATLSNSLTLVDSVDQLDRLQTIDGQRTTMRQYAKRICPKARVETLLEFQTKSRPKFDFALCANVLSAIPIKAARSKALSAIKSRLRSGAHLLVVNQHANSFYTDVAKRRGVVRHLDGWLVPNGKSAYYYGILDAKKTSKLLRNSGFQVERHWITGQSTYVLVRLR